MKLTKIIFSILTIIFGILGLLRILPYDISMPIMIFAMATSLLITSFEYKKKQDKNGFILTLLVALFGYGTIIYFMVIG